MICGLILLGSRYEELPYFYTDQYDLGMEYVGHVSGGYDQVVVRGDLEARQFIAFWLKEGRVKAGMTAPPGGHPLGRSRLAATGPAATS